MTVLVLSGVTKTDDIPTFAYRPDCVLKDVGALVQYAKADHKAEQFED